MADDVPFLPISEYESRYKSQNIQEIYSACEGGEDAKLVAKAEARKFYPEDGGTYSVYVDLILEGMGMQKYAPIFKDQDIGVDILVQLNADDLIALGINDADDRDCILSHLKEFTGDARGNYKSSQDSDSINRIHDDLIMVRNVYHHLVELNSYVAQIQYQLSKNSKLEDYFISSRMSGLTILKLVTNNALTQTHRIADILYESHEQKDGLVNLALKVGNTELPVFMKEKLKNGTRVTRRVRKKRVIVTVMLAVGIVVCALSFRRKHFMS